MNKISSLGDMEQFYSLCSSFIAVIQLLIGLHMFSVSVLRIWGMHPEVLVSRFWFQLHVYTPETLFVC